MSEVSVAVNIPGQFFISHDRDRNHTFGARDRSRHDGALLHFLLHYAFAIYSKYFHYLETLLQHVFWKTRRRGFKINLVLRRYRFVNANTSLTRAIAFVFEVPNRQIPEGD